MMVPTRTAARVAVSRAVRLARMHGRTLHTRLQSTLHTRPWFSAALIFGLAVSGNWACRSIQTRPAQTSRESAPLATRDTVDVDLGVSNLPLTWTDGNGKDNVVSSADLAAAGGRLLLRGPVVLGGSTHEGDVALESQRPGGDGRVRLSVRLALETYVAGVVAAELPLWSAEEEELCAQAIAARTFALHALRSRGPLRRNADTDAPVRLVAGVADQAYRGSYVVPASSPSRGAVAAAARLRRAVDRTRGQVLLRSGTFEEARYHAACGGHTSDFADVFASEAESGARGPLGVPCSSCAARAGAEAAARKPDDERPLGWLISLDQAEREALGRAAGLDGSVDRFGAAKVDRAGRWLALAVTSASGQSRTITFENARRALGYSRVKSAMIVAQRPRAGQSIGPDALRLQGRGRGHGVGLCQEAAHDLAAQGWSHERILRHFYPGASIVTLPSANDISGGMPARRSSAHAE